LIKKFPAGGYIGSFLINEHTFDKVWQPFSFVKIRDSFLKFQRVGLVCSNKDMVCIMILAVFLKSRDVFFVIIQGFRWEKSLLLDIEFLAL
jgi:hypothetical protein